MERDHSIPSVYFPTSLLAILLLCMAAGGARSASAQPTSTGDLYARMLVARRELEELRRYMGCPKYQATTLIVHDVSPRELHTMATLMLQSADKLCFEHTRQHSTPRHEVEGEATLDDSLQLVETTIAYLRSVKQQYGLDPSSDDMPVHEARTLADVYASLLATDRQLNRLLERPVETREVHRQATIATLYAAKLLEQFPGSTPMPSPPEFEPNKEPTDVHARLLRCLKQVHQIAVTIKVNTLHIEPTEVPPADVQSGDLLGLATILTAELRHLHSLVPDAEMPEEVYYVDRKFPSHVYQSAGTLEQQLAELTRLVRNNPQWLLGNELTRREQ